MAFLTKLPCPHRCLKGSARYHSSALPGSRDAEIYIIQYFSSPLPAQLATHLAQARLKTHEPEPSYCTGDRRCPSQEDGWVHRRCSGEQGALSSHCSQDLEISVGQFGAWLGQTLCSGGASSSASALAGAYRKWSVSRDETVNPSSTPIMGLGSCISNAHAAWLLFAPSSPAAWRVSSKISNRKDAPEVCCRAVPIWAQHRSHWARVLGLCLHKHPRPLSAPMNLFIQQHQNHPCGGNCKHLPCCFSLLLFRHVTAEVSNILHS